MRRDVFQAIADPTRREIINLLARQPMNLNTVAEKFDVSRPAISKHVKILVECGLIIVQEHGRERICEAKLESLREVYDWVDKYKKIWTQRFDKLKNYLDELQSKDKRKKKAKKNR